MIRSIRHKGLKAFFFQGAALPASLVGRGGEFCTWLSILNAAAARRDLSWPGAKVMTRANRKAGGWFVELNVFGLGVFEFEFVEAPGPGRNCFVEQLDFKSK